MIRRVLVSLAIVGALLLPIGVVSAEEGYWESPIVQVMSSWVDITSPWTNDLDLLAGDHHTFELTLHNASNSTAAVEEVLFKVLVPEGVTLGANDVVVAKWVHLEGWVTLALDENLETVLNAEPFALAGSSAVTYTLRVTFNKLGRYQFVSWFTVS